MTTKMQRPSFLEMFAAVNAHTDAHGAVATRKILSHVGGVDVFGLIDLDRMPHDQWAKAIRALAGEIPVAELEAETAARKAAEAKEARTTNSQVTLGTPHSQMAIEGESVAGKMLILPPTRR